VLAAKAAAIASIFSLLLIAHLRASSVPNQEAIIAAVRKTPARSRVFR
jgi:hypothetical protein